MSLAERWKTALEQSQESWKSRIVKEEPVREFLTQVNQKSLQSRRFELEKAVGKWQQPCFLPSNKNKNNNKNMNKAENQENNSYQALIYKNGGGVVRHRSPLGAENWQNCLSELSKDEKFAEQTISSFELKEMATNVVISNILEKNDMTSTIIEENNNLLKFPKRPAPARQTGNRKTRALQTITDQPIVEEKVLTVKDLDNGENNVLVCREEKKTILEQEFNELIEKKSESLERNLNTTLNIASKLSADAFQTPVIGVEHCGVKLRQVDTASAFPKIMLVQFQGSRFLNIRLVCPKLSPQKLNFFTGFGSYLLITSNRLIVWNADDATVFEKSKACQMAYDILAVKELSCLASKVEIANDDSSIMADFKQIVTEKDYSLSNNNNPCLNEGISFENATDEMSEESNRKFYIDDVVYSVTNKDGVIILATGEAPSSRHFDSSKVLVFDFVTEIYVWIGRYADRMLISKAVNHAESLRSRPLTIKQKTIFGSILNEAKDLKERPAWTIFRKQTQGIVDCLFRFKFEDFCDRIAQLNAAETSQTCFATPSLSNKHVSGVEKRPWSVQPASNRLSIMTNRISALCSDDAYFGILKDEEKLINDLATTLGSRPEPIRQSLELEFVNLQVTDKNVFTEKLVFYRLVNEETLECLSEPLLEFNNSSCYVIKWHYRIEREGIRRLNNDRILMHETGRERVAYFYWLGLMSSVKDRSRCALALRNFDKNRQQHVRIESGYEPPVFLNLLNGRMIVSGTESGWFLVIGSSGTLFSAEELPMPIEFRSQGVYLQIDKSKIICWRGVDSTEEVLKGAIVLGTQLGISRGLEFDKFPQELTLHALKTQLFSLPKSTKLLCPEKWNRTAPRLYRLYGNEGIELEFERFDNEINFSFRQSDLKDCVLVDQGSLLWIWSENVVRTFELKVADKMWHDIKGKSRENEENVLIILKGHEPDSFKALFATWIDKESDWIENDGQNLIQQTFTLQSLKSLLRERTRFRSPNELRTRQLPQGCDTKHLERYLTNLNFQEIFKCTKGEYEKLPRWKQISLKKEANLF